MRTFFLFTSDKVKENTKFFFFLYFASKKKIRRNDERKTFDHALMSVYILYI